MESGTGRDMGTDRVQPANDDDARTGRGKRAADCLKIARGDEDTDAWLKLGGGWIAGYSAARWRKCGEINPTQPNQTRGVLSVLGPRSRACAIDRPGFATQ